MIKLGTVVGLVFVFIFASLAFADGPFDGLTLSPSPRLASETFHGDAPPAGRCLSVQKDRSGFAPPYCDVCVNPGKGVCFRIDPNAAITFRTASVDAKKKTSEATAVVSGYRVDCRNHNDASTSAPTKADLRVSCARKGVTARTTLLPILYQAGDGLFGPLVTGGSAGTSVGPSRKSGQPY